MATQMIPSDWALVTQIPGGPSIYRTPTGEQRVVQSLDSMPMGDSASQMANFGSVTYDPSGPEVGNPLDFFDQGGQFTHSGVTHDIGSLGSDLAKFAAMAGGLAFGLPALQGATGAGAAGAAAAPWEAGFVGTDALTGTGAMGAAGSAGAGGAALGGGGAAGAAGAAGGGAASGGLGGMLSGLSPSALGIGASLLGGLAGSGSGEPGQVTDSAQRTLDPRLDAPVFGDLIPRTQGLLAAQMPGAGAAGATLANTGTGLLGSQMPSGASNPYLKSIADDMQRRTSELLGENNLAIHGNAVANGGLGGSRQGVAQGIAAGRAADSLQGQVAGLFGNAFENDSNRQLQKIGLGADLLTQGAAMPWMPLRQTADIFGTFVPGTSSTSGTRTIQEPSDGKWQNALSTGLGIYGTGKEFKWW